MNVNQYRKGIALPVIIAIVAVLTVFSGVVYFNTQPEEEIMMKEGKTLISDGEDMMKEGKTLISDGEDMLKEGEAMMEEEGYESALIIKEDSVVEPIFFKGEILAGTPQTPLLEFNQTDYDKALASGKLVTLYFYANWCPICKVEFPEMQKAFDALETDTVVGFRVNFKDSEVTKEEETLAKEHGVPYQHTKVFIKDGKRLLKSPESWNTARFISEITKYSKG